MPQPLFAFFPIFVLPGLLIGFLPTIIAVARRHPSVVAIFLVNLLLGWTVIGWFWALFWSFSTPRVVVAVAPAQYGNPPAGYGAVANARLLCPRCGNEVTPGQRFCSTCGAAL